MVLGMQHGAYCGTPAPMGGSYTIGWQLAEIIGRVYDPDLLPVWGKIDEDCLVGLWPTIADEEYEFVTMDPAETLDVVVQRRPANELGSYKQEFLAREWEGDKIIRAPIQDVKSVEYLHQLKQDAKWIAVQQYFDERGWDGRWASRERNVTMVEEANDQIRI